MQNYLEVLRLHELGMGQRKIAQQVHTSRDTIRKIIAIAENQGLNYSNLIGKTDNELSKVFGRDIQGKTKPDPIYEMPDFDKLSKELRRPGVTMTLLWEEYCYDCRQNNKIPYKRSQFFYHFDHHLQSTGFTDIIHHKPGEETEVDWAGTQPSWFDPDTREQVKGYLFIGVLAFSGYAYAEACADMKEESWINCHIHMFDYFQGITKILVPDNLKTGVTKHLLHEEAELNSAYQELAEYYGIVIIPARVRHPKDKPLAENTVNQCTKNIIAKLRDYKFFSLDEYNRQVMAELNQFNQKLFQKKPGSRAENYRNIELDCLQPLPQYPYEYAEWRKAKVQSNSHIAFDKKYYSVPHEYIGQEVELRITKKNITVYYQHLSLCIHTRIYGHDGAYDTFPEHMPPSSNAASEWNQDRFIKWANEIGTNTVQVITNLFAQYKYEQQGYNGAKSILMLASKYSNERLENACGTALAHISHPRYKNIKAILENKQEKKDSQSLHPVVPAEKAFLRGADYYKDGNLK